MNNRGLHVLLITVVFTLLNLPPFVFASDGINEQETLRGINTLHVMVQGLESGLEQYGLTRGKLEKDLVTKLGMAGIKVVSKKEGQMVPGAPSLTLMVGALRAFTTKDTEFYFISIIIKLRQNVYLERRPKNRVLGITTWSNTRFGINFAQNIRTEVNDAIDRFINAYVAANSK
ncbi:MAG: hypothetical protein JSV50_12480 [Desulfobacteraceae bacterium]|nr:MAG: hypothetical protein JSV50_12480 [Desulfobacteraceae bacterium]